VNVLRKQRGTTVVPAMMNKNHLKKYCHSRVNGNLKYENTLPVIARIPNDEVDRETKQSANLFAAFFESAK
jgi:hypothetical protein